MSIPVTRTLCKKPKFEDESTLGFGRVFTDHMFIADYEEELGWHDARIVPYQPFSIDPASPVLHYSLEVFEGLKAYHYENGEVGLFRPELNCERLNSSAERMCLPPIDANLQLEAIETLVDLERDWVPKSSGTSLYIRPTMIGDGSRLGICKAQRYIYYIICSPSGSFYPRGIQPLRIYIEDSYVRAVAGGTGCVKTGGNYASSLLAATNAKQRGFDQVLWLDGRENKYIEEVGAMNVMFVLDGVLTTPAINGSILNGITRRSVLSLARSMDIPAVERTISVDELFEASRTGRLTEAFGTGTAAVISPIGELEYKGKSIVLGEQIGPVAKVMYDTLTSIQTGRIPDERGWTRIVPRIFSPLE